MNIDEIISYVRNLPNFNMWECDGCTQILDYLLTEHGIEHTVYSGNAFVGSGYSIPHFWIMIEGKILDLKAKMWFGETAKEGLFYENESIVNYSTYGRPLEMETSKFMFDILTKYVETAYVIHVYHFHEKRYSTDI